MAVALPSLLTTSSLNTGLVVISSFTLARSISRWVVRVGTSAVNSDKLTPELVSNGTSNSEETDSTESTPVNSSRTIARRSSAVLEKRSSLGSNVTTRKSLVP